MEEISWSDLFLITGAIVFGIIFVGAIWLDMSGRIERWASELNEDLDKVETEEDSK